jgi:hypothetical protein
MVSLLIKPAKITALAKYISIEDASKLSGYNVHYIRRSLRARKIDGLKVSRIWFLDSSDLVKYLMVARKATD